MSVRRLEGVRVLVTRPRERAEETCFLLEDEGAEVLALPMLELEPPSDGRGLRAAAETLGRFTWVAFASPAAVEALVEAARTAGTTALLRRTKVAVVGPGTARMARAAGLEVALEARGGSGAALGAELAPRLHPGDEVLLPAAEHGRAELEAALVGAGGGSPGAVAGATSSPGVVTRVAAYRSTPLVLDASVWADLRARPPAAVLFASPRTAEAFLEGGGRPLLERARAVAIGPTTAAALAELGVPAAEVAARPTPVEMVEAAVRAIRG